MKYIELINSIAVTVIKIYKYQIIGCFCENCNSVANLVAQEIGVTKHAWVCGNCGEDGNSMIPIETQLEEIKEDIEKNITDADYFSEIDENDEIKIALTIIKYVNNFIKEKEKWDALEKK